ncbi:MAG: phosphotransferase family protein [Nodosilinea sp.]
MDSSLLPAGQPLPTTPLKLLAHGEANLIFRLGTDRLVRLAVNTPNQRFGGDFSRVTAFEGEILRYLQGAGLGHTLWAEQLKPTNRFPYTYLITNYLEGQPLNYSRQHLQYCAETLARLHCLPLVPGYGPIDQVLPQVQRLPQPLSLFFQEAQDYAQPYLDFPEAEPEIVDLLKAVLAKAKDRLGAEPLLTQHPHQCLVHSDHTYENWVINDHTAYLIDWEWAEIGSPAGDLGHFLSPVTVRRYHNYSIPLDDRAFFLQTYYKALGDAALADTMAIHFAVFGAFPAVRSLCWTAGYWVTARCWYADAVAESASAAARLARLEASRQQFPHMAAEVMAWLEEPLP